MRAIVAAGLMAAALTGEAAAQTGEKLTIERVWGDPALAGPAPRLLRFAPDGQSVTYLKPKDSDARILDLWTSDLETGAARLLVDGAKLNDGGQLSEAEKARRERQRIFDTGVVEYSWDGAGKAILAPVAGDLFLADPATGAVRQLTKSGGDEIDAKLSPKGTYASYAREQNLYLMTVADRAERAVSTDGGGAISYGVAEFIAEEELDRHTGTWWAPNESRLAFARVDESAVPLIVRADIGADGRTTQVSQRYPAAGEPNAVVELHVLDLATGKTVRADLGKGEDYYLARVNWTKDAAALLVQRLSRDQKRLDIVRVDAATGASRILLTETDAAWINLTHDLKPLSDGRFLWTSERDGWNHIYLIGADGKVQRQVTKGQWPVRAIKGVDEKSGRVFFLASPEDPLQQHLHVVSYTRGGAPKQLTQGEGSWEVEFNGDGSAFLGKFSAPMTPPQTALYDASGKRLRWIEENALDADHPFAPYAARLPAPEFGAITAKDGTTLYTRVLKPPGFDPTKRYPAILYVYGGPHSQVVQKSWDSTSMRLRLLQEQGYVVFSIDNRGTLHRGRAFERAIAGEFFKHEVADQLEGVAWLKTQPYVDPARVGVWGWSYGGSMTLALALRAPKDTFKAAASFAPVTDWRLYDTAYTERYQGTPQGNAAGYAGSDLVAQADTLSTRLLLVHGLADDNVVFANSAAFMAALQAQSIPFETMVYPGQKHGIAARPSAIHWARTLTAFFDSALEPGR